MKTVTLCSVAALLEAEASFVGCCCWCALFWFCFTWWICCSGFFRLGCNIYWVLVFNFFKIFENLWVCYHVPCFLSLDWVCNLLFRIDVGLFFLGRLALLQIFWAFFFFFLLESRTYNFFFFFSFNLRVFLILWLRVFLI